MRWVALRALVSGSVPIDVLHDPRAISCPLDLELFPVLTIIRQTANRGPDIFEKSFQRTTAESIGVRASSL
jgi:hypothetical protein